MSAAPCWKVGLSATGLSCLLMVGYVRAQRQVDEHIKPAQYADQNTGEPLRADQTHQNQTYRGDRGDRMERREGKRGERRTTYFRGPDAAGSNDGNTSASVNHYLANCLLIHNQGEIAINQFAEGKSQNDEVKQFAQQMVRDHQQLSQKLERVAGSNRQARQDPTLAKLVSIDRAMSEKCGEMTKAKLEGAAANEFDRCFVSSQVGAHMQMLSALEVISQQADGELQQVAQDAQTTVKQQLEHAEKLMKQLDSSVARQARVDR